MAGQKSLGTTIALGGKVIGNLKSIGEVGGTAEEIDVTTLDSDGGYREFLQGFKDAGEVAIQGFLLDNDKTNQSEVVRLFDNGENVQSVITFPSKATMTFNSFVKSYKIGPGEVEGAIGFSASIRVVGKPTYATATTPNATTES